MSGGKKPYPSIMNNVNIVSHYYPRVLRLVGAFLGPPIIGDFQIRYTVYHHIQQLK